MEEVELPDTPPPPRTKWTRRVPHPILIGQVELPDAPSGWSCFRLRMAVDPRLQVASHTFAASSAAERARWVAAARLFCTGFSECASPPPPPPPPHLSY